MERAPSRSSGRGVFATGEDHGLKDYKDDDDKLGVQAKTLVWPRLLPAQQDTHAPDERAQEAPVLVVVVARPLA